MQNRRFLQPNTARTDRVVQAGWLVILLFGQCALNTESLLLESLAVAWLCAGMRLVRRSVCLPLLMLTCPAFMCEIQRPWAWAQVLVAGVFLGRMFFEERSSSRDRWIMAGVGLTVLFFAWPRDMRELLRELSTFSKREWFSQFLHAHATWAMYPIRQTFDRALIGATVAGLVLKPAYVSSVRLWRSYLGCGVLMLVATFCAALLPWQEPHRFLGTTNFAAFNDYHFHGAGYNPYFFTMPVVAMIPWLFIPFKSRWRWACLGMVALLFPIPFVGQRALGMGVRVLVLLGCAFLAAAVATGAGRRKLLARIRWQGKKVGRLLAALVLCGAFSLSWAVKMNVVGSSSLWKRMTRTFPELASVLAVKDRAGEQEPAAAPVERTGVKQEKKAPRGEAEAASPNPAFAKDRASGGVGTDGRDLWYGKASVPQGVVTFGPHAALWADLKKGTIITVAEGREVRDERGGLVAAGLRVERDGDGGWIHVGASTEGVTEAPLVTARSNIKTRESGGFSIRNIKWQVRIRSADGATVSGPVNVYMSAGKVWQLQQRWNRPITEDDYEGAFESTFGLPNAWGDGRDRQTAADLDAASPGSGAIAPLVVNEISAGDWEGTPKGVAGDARLGRVHGNGGNWLELVVTRDGLDIRGWHIEWAYAEHKKERTTLEDRFWKLVKNRDKARSHMWRLGIQESLDESMWKGAGAGTWARFHRSVSRPRIWKRNDARELRFREMIHHPHMHNTYLDLIYEHGVLPMIFVYLLAGVFLIRLVFLRGGPSRLWLFPIAGIGAMALAQNFFYAFTSQCLLLPLLALIFRNFARPHPRAKRGMGNAVRGAQGAG